MKSLYSLILLFFTCGFVSAQMNDGSDAPLWTLADFQTGELYSLEDYIDAGIPVILDFSATWCPPCWSYHQSHVLADIYDEYGPTGSVEQDAAMVFFMEGDYGTNDDCLYGDNANCSGTTMGDWTDGTPYPIFNIPASTGLTAAYQIGYWPTLYAVSPQGTVYEVGQASKSTWESWIFETFALSVDGASITEIDCPEDGGSIDITVSGGSGSLDFLWSNGSTDEDLVGVPAGDYTVEVTEGRGYTILSETFTIEAGPDPLEADLQGEDIACNGEANGTVTANIEGGVGNYTYMWNTGETTPTISGLSGGTYTVEVLDENDCYITSTYMISEPEVLEQENITFPASCGDDSGQASIDAIGGTAPFLFTLNGMSNTNGVFTNVPGGGHVATIEDANGCSIIFSIMVGEIEEPEAVVVAGEMPTCDSPQVILNGNGSTSGNVTYVWYSNDGGTIVDGQGTLYPTIEGNGTYTLLVTDQSYNCTAEASVEIEADLEVPVADAGLGQTITCDVLEVVLNGSNSSQGSNFTYQWSTAEGNIVEGGDTNEATVNAAGTYIILVTNTNNGCTSESSVEVIQTAGLPVADAGLAEDITCEVTSITLDGSASEIGDDIEYTWTTDDGIIVGGENTLNPEVNAPGTYLLEVLNVASGCVSYSSVIVEENTTSPEAEIMAADVLTCVLDEQALVVMVDAENVMYNWTTTDGNIIEGSDSQMPIIDAPGTYMVTYTDLATGCSGTQTVEVTEFINTPEADFSFSANQTVFTFSDESLGDPSEYAWDFGDGNTSTEENPTHEYTENGQYQVCLTITNECGSSETCSTISITIGAPLTYDSSLETPTCNASCDGTLTIDPDADKSEITTIVTGPNGFVSEDVYELTDLCAGEYTIEITNQIDETVTETIEIFEPDAILVEESEVVHIDCAGNENGRIEIDLSGGTGILSVEWSNGAEGLVLEDLPGGEYQATIKDEQGCTHVVDFIVEEPTEVDVDVIDITNIDTDNPTGAIDIEVTGGVEPYEYLWSNGDQTEDVADLDFGEYTVIVTDANGCKDTYGPYEVKNLVAVKDIELLNAFNISPNPTTDNFTLELEFLSKTDARISLINNLGQEITSEVISSSVYTKNYNVSDLPSGMYMLRVQVGNEVSIKKIVKQ